MTSSGNPYEPPGSDTPPEASTPRVRDLVVATIAALLAGISIFVGTCFGTGILLISLSLPGPAPQWIDWAGPIMFLGCALLGVGAGLVLGRIVYTYRRKTRSSVPEPEEHSVLTSRFYDSRVFRTDQD